MAMGLLQKISPWNWRWANPWYTSSSK